MIWSLKAVYIKSSSNFLVDSKKSTVSFEINKSTDVINFGVIKNFYYICFLLRMILTAPITRHLFNLI